MNILLTGAFGNIGTSTLNELIKVKENYIRCFDIPTKRNKKQARKYRKYHEKIDIFWGDLQKLSDVESAMENIDIVLHLGAIIPPLANKKPEIAEPVNVGGTRNILIAIKKQNKKPKLVFSSSVAIYGDIRHNGLNHVIKITDPINPSPHDHYARHKIKCERMIRESNVEWLIFRFSAIPPLDQNLDPIMFDVPLDTPIEYTHTQDTGFALAQAIKRNDLWGKTLHIAGGPKNRLLYSDFVGRMLEKMGIGRLPKEAFTNKPFHCGFMDTSESQELLKYQNHFFEDYLESTKQRWILVRWLILLFRPIIRSWMLRKSPYYRAHIKSMKSYLKKPVKLDRKDKKKKGKKDTKKPIATKPVKSKSS